MSTYYQRKIIKTSQKFYENTKKRLKKRARNRHRKLSLKEKSIKIGRERNRY